MNWLARGLILIPVIAAVGALLCPPGARRLLGSLAIGAAAGAVALAGGQLISGARVEQTPLLPSVPSGAGSLDLLLHSDRSSALLSVMVATVTLAVQCFSVRYQQSDSRYRAYSSAISLFAAAMLLVIAAEDLVLLLIGWEVMGLCSYLLIGHDRTATARGAAAQAFLVTRTADLAVVGGIILLWFSTGTTRITEVLAAPISEPVRLAAVAGILIGVLGKSAQLPFSHWLPAAMAGPTPVSALIHAATMVAAGAVVLIRLEPLLRSVPVMRSALALVAAVTMVLAALAACAQADLKRVLAWSTIGQMSYLLAAIAVGSPQLGAAPALAQLLAHASFKALLFLLAGALAWSAHSTKFNDLAGGLRGSRFLLFAGTTALASLAGFPLLAGFIGKEAVLLAATEAASAGQWAGWLVLLSALISGMITAGYATRSWLLLTRPSGVPVFLPGTLTWPLILLLMPTVGAGFLWWPGLLPGSLHPDWGTAVLTTALALIGAGITYRMGRDGVDPATRLPNWWRDLAGPGRALDDRLVIRQQSLVIHPISKVVSAIAWVEEHLLEGVNRGFQRLIARIGAALTQAQTGATTGYLRWLWIAGLGAILAGVSWR